MVIASIAVLATWGLRYGIDFTGGTMMEFGFNGTALTSNEIKAALKDQNLGDINIQPSGSGTVFMKFKNVDETTHQAILTALNNVAAAKAGNNPSSATTTSQPAASATSQSGSSPVSVTAQTADGNNVTVQPANGSSTQATNNSATSSETKKYIAEKSFETIGPVVGNELKSSALWAIVIAVTAIILYIAWAFRKVSYPVSSFKYGIIAASALLHDVLTTVGVFAIIGHFLNVEIGVSFVAAVLTILGYSVHDTIVVFDRIRENLFKSGWTDFEETVNRCVNETLTRSINTSFTVILTLTALFLFGGESIRYFVLTLIIGVTVGTYSSIFVASPLLVTWQQYDLKRKGKSGK